MKAILALAALALASAANGTTVLSDSFNTENGGNGQLNYAGFANFTVNGQVDLIEANNPYGIVAPSAVVDLDGSNGPGELVSHSFAFAGGDTVTLRFVLGGAQRGSVSDSIYGGFAFGTVTTFDHFTYGGGFGGPNDIGSFTTGMITTSTAVAGTSPYQAYTLSFVASGAGTVQAFVGTESADGVGPLLDSVKLDIGTVPEPASWALMLAGFGLVGVAARRRASAAA